MIQLDESIEVARPPDAVYDALAAVERYPDWLPGVSAAEQLSSGPVEPGTTFRLQLAGPTGPIQANGMVVSAERARRLAVRGEAPQGRVEGAFDLEAAGSGTRLRVAVQIELSGMYRFAEGVVAGELRRSMPDALARARTRLEDEIPA